MTGSRRVNTNQAAVTFLAADRHHPLTSTKLYCLVTQARMCESFAQSRSRDNETTASRTRDLSIASNHTVINIDRVKMLYVNFRNLCHCCCYFFFRFCVDFRCFFLFSAFYHIIMNKDVYTNKTLLGECKPPPTPTPNFQPKVIWDSSPDQIAGLIRIRISARFLPKCRSVILP